MKAVQTKFFRESSFYHFVDHPDHFGVLFGSGSQTVLVSVGVSTIREVGALLVQHLVPTRGMLSGGVGRGFLETLPDCEDSPVDLVGSYGLPIRLALEELG